MYLTSIPNVPYRFSVNNQNMYQLVKNISFRVGILEEVKNNIFAYYTVTIPNGERPDTMAEKVYNNPYLHWIIFLANDMVNPIHEWPKSYEEFDNYIISKYGSIATAQTTYNHYEKIITRENLIDNVTDVTNLIVDFDTYSAIAAEGDYASYTTTNNKTINETITRNAVSFYDYENQINEDRRIIKLIKPEYVQRIVEEFQVMTGTRKLSPGYRTFT